MNPGSGRREPPGPALGSVQSGAESKGNGAPAPATLAASAPEAAGGSPISAVAPLGQTVADTLTPPIAEPPAGAADAVRKQTTLNGEEHLAYLVKLRRVAAVGIVVWACFMVMDYLVDRNIQPGVLAWLLPLRWIGCGFVACTWLALRFFPPSTPRGLLAMDCFMFSVNGALISLMCVGFGGFLSPYAGGVPLVLVARGAFVAMPWRLGLLPNCLTAATYPLALLGSLWFSAPLRAQLADPVAPTLFALHLSFILGTLAFSVVGGHSAWALRRELFEARSVGRYRLVRRIGSGGMGEVWVALQPGLKRHVAMKILQVGRLGDPTALRRFEREVMATTELSHPNTVRIYDYGVTPDGLWYYTMELLEGVDLARLVAKHGPLPARRAVHIGVQAARALSEAHGRGIVHRDVKPENLFVIESVTEPDFVKVLDFGIAQVVSEDSRTRLTMEGWIGGTPTYMSPEVAAGRAADARSDVYGLAAVLYFAVAGRPPFEQTNVPALLAARLAAPPERPSEKLGKPIASDLEAFILRNLAQSPLDRCASASEFAEELASLKLAE